MPGQRPIYPVSKTISPATRDQLIVTRCHQDEIYAIGSENLRFLLPSNL